MQCSSSTPQTTGQWWPESQALSFSPALLSRGGLFPAALAPFHPCPLRCAFLRRGIDVVRNKIKMFAQKKVTLPSGRHKIILLDEADRSADRRMPPVAHPFCLLRPPSSVVLVQRLE